MRPLVSFAIRKTVYKWHRIGITFVKIRILNKSVSEASIFCQGCYKHFNVCSVRLPHPLFSIDLEKRGMVGVRLGTNEAK